MEYDYILIINEIKIILIASSISTPIISMSLLLYLKHADPFKTLQTLNHLLLYVYLLVADFQINH
jgi:hypothetical protein